MFWLYSLWLPITAITVFLSGAIGTAFGSKMKVSAILALILILTYTAIFWVPAEFSSRLANNPHDHFRAAIAMANRAQIFGDDNRSLKHYQTAAAANHPQANYVMGSYYDYGYNGFTRNRELAIVHYNRAKKLGFVDEWDRLGQLINQ